MPWQYSEKTMQLFMDAVHGKAGTHLGEITEPDGLGEHGSIVCGDALRFSFRVERHPSDPLQDIITEARYLTFGCTSAIAASEALCTLVERERYTPIQALKITNYDIVEFLGGLPEQKIHCSVMGAEALEAAVADWAKKRGVDLTAHGVKLRQEEHEEGRLVCKCFSLSEPYLKRKIRELNLRTIADITNATKAGGACTACHFAPGGLQDLLDEAWGKTTSPRLAVISSSAAQDRVAQSEAQGSVSPYHWYKEVEKVVAELVKPQLEADGGSIEIVDIKDKLVYCRLQGACARCPSSGQTLKLMVEKTLKDQLDEQIRVIAV